MGRGAAQRAAARQAIGVLAAVLRNVVRMRGRTERRAELRHSVVAARERLAESAADAAARVAVTLQHGGRIRLQVRDKAGVFLPGTLTLVGPDGVASKPGLDGADGYYERDGKLLGNGPVVIFPVIAPGTWQLAIDLGKFGIHRRTVEVRACEVTEVDVTVQ